MTLIAQFLGRLVRPASDDRGQGLAEYALIIALIALIAIIALIFFGEQLAAEFGRIGDTVDRVT